MANNQQKQELRVVANGCCGEKLHPSKATVVRAGHGSKCQIVVCLECCPHAECVPEEEVLQVAAGLDGGPESASGTQQRLETVLAF